MTHESPWFSSQKQPSRPQPKESKAGSSQVKPNPEAYYASPKPLKTRVQPQNSGNNRDLEMNSFAPDYDF